MASELTSPDDDGGSGAVNPSIRCAEDDASIVVSFGDRSVVVSRWCPHRGGDLAAGRVLGNALQCPLHGYLFSLETGLGLNNSFRLDIETPRSDR